ncbi:di-heme oxidoreductase family protein [Chitinophagaceae bacterium MMS25-I14]
MKKTSVLLCIVSMVMAFSMCRKAETFSDDGYDERLSGGGLATIFDITSKAFTHGVDGLAGRDADVQKRGDVAFEQTFVSSPAPLFGGLGPIFNNVSCISCHHNDGKGTPTAGDVRSSLLFRVTSGVPNANGGPSGMVGYGGQIQDVALQGVQPEAKISISYTDQVVTYPDGAQVHLRKPDYTLQNLYTPMQGGYQLSPRLAPPVFGLGLLANIPESTILSFADESDADNDGISGKANYVYNPQTKQKELGRFGLKANTSTIAVQVATAYQQDMGVTSSIQPLKSCSGQMQMNPRDVGAAPDLPDSTLNAVIFYIKTLAVPARRDVLNADVKRGQQLFVQLNCSGCHKPTIQTGVDVTSPYLSNQRIHPYTDLLVHDMGAGLADGYTDYLAGASEWRTMPLWGIGLFEKTNGTPYYLHDGRARTIEEAILWHGGEAQKPRDNFMQLSKTDRDAVVTFLRSL